MQSKKIVLATNSEIRRKIASRFSSDVRFVSPKINEEDLKNKFNHLPPEDMCYELAKAKSLSITDYPDEFILGCDQICLLGNKVFSKPINAENSIEQLNELKGKTHKLIGHYVFSKNNEVILSEQIICEMNMRALTNDEIISYVKLDEPFFSCGAYKFEENGFTLFNSVIGSLEAINGLPLKELYEKLNEQIQSN